PSTPLDQSSVTEAKNRLDQLQTDFRNAEQKLQAQQRAGLLSYADYVVQRGELISQNKDQVTAAYEGEIQALEALRDKSSTTAAQRISLDQKIAEARNNMVKAQKRADADLEVLQLNEQGRLKKQAQAVKAYSDALQQQQDALALQGQRAAAAVGMGAQQRRLFDQRGSLDDRLAQQRLDLASQYGDGSRGMSLDEYNDKLKALEANHAAMTQQLQRNYADLQVAQGNWVNGATSAFADYIDSARDGAGQTYELFSNAFSGLEDAVVNFVMTGKASLDDFVRTMIGDVARMATRQLGASLLSGLGLGGGTDGGAQGLTVGASAVSASAGALATAGGTLLSGAAAIQAAAASLAAANGVSGVSGAAGAAGAAGVAGGGSGWLSSITSIFGFAGGGQVQGPGTPTSDSIPAWLSNNEVVIRSASAMQPGLTPLLLDINQRGWAALHDWAGAVRHATGGVAGIPAPSLPRPSMGAAQIQEPSKNFSTAVNNAVHLHAVQDPDQMAADMWAGKGGDHYIVWLNKNRQLVKQIIG
ncbi:TPA: phage tail tape-measure protein, partial [Pseudomonas aeruginosa]|nr:phage tail tape-measure protein [Pseudomonas aeruginosa]